MLTTTQNLISQVEQKQGCGPQPQPVMGDKLLTKAKGSLYGLLERNMRAQDNNMFQHMCDTLKYSLDNDAKQYQMKEMEFQENKILSIIELTHQLDMNIEQERFTDIEVKENRSLC
ncbi:hypothetical protein O181_058751 [Austropuccinia psidii MF-1]|uniref:Uncharacterized protein n=1 Tax=Austropuccinia psidii MF-1 TaxID=1389203 RepID=A0A9Q3EHP1_9BASI|nr:hypothetical protein [Austropuccinia psidii MF-1]